MKRFVIATILLAGVFALVFVGTASAAPAKWVTGYVYGSNAGPTALSGAKVTVRLNSHDPHFDAKNPANNVIGVGYTDRLGRYFVSVSWWHWFGLPVGSYIEVSAKKEGYLAVTQWGRLDTAYMTVNFSGAACLPLDEGQIPPLPREW
jgi:hypothetical protein